MFGWEYAMVKSSDLTFLNVRLRCNLFTQFLQDYLPEYLETIPLNIRQRCWFQQDNAPAHFHHDVRTFLDEQYPNCWISREGPVS